MKINTTLILFCLSAMSVSATELVYTPINPSFGGNPLNGSMLLNKAQSQNRHTAHREEATFAERLEDSLERAVISRLVRELTDLTFGTLDEDSIFQEDQTFTYGDQQIEIIASNSDYITVRITNTLTGEVVVVEVPKTP